MTDGSSLLPSSPSCCSIGATSKLKYLVNSSANSFCGVHFKIGIVVVAVVGHWKEQALARNDGILTAGFTIFGMSLVFLPRLCVTSDGKFTKWPRAWCSLTDSKAPFSTVSPSGLEASFGMLILRLGHGSASHNGKNLCWIPEFNANLDLGGVSS